MSIKDLMEKGKSFLGVFYAPILIFLIAFIFFIFGRLSTIEERHTSIQITYPNYPNASSTATALQSVSGAVSQGSVRTKSPYPQALTASVTPGNASGSNSSTSTYQSASLEGTGEVIGSRSGKKYYFPWCGTLKRVKKQNQIHFASIGVARVAGYVPAHNCKGLQ